ncbi:hypothetical protein BV22DRAFT_139437 [Leucogyrophana mollusca]|uniref:Uncharacterized protein n=1 Tax=Leucogyrophana mollusca TaxID=85980 RepID=A0ACB8BUQ3_9AGAM|nr:hypothetical protein BV22DRAFT_139437 [Leucogyrophana mollusca]
MAPGTCWTQMVQTSKCQLGFNCEMLTIFFFPRALRELFLSIFVYSSEGIGESANGRFALNHHEWTRAIELAENIQAFTQTSTLLGTSSHCRFHTKNSAATRKDSSQSVKLQRFSSNSECALASTRSGPSLLTFGLGINRKMTILAYSQGLNVTITIQSTLGVQARALRYPVRQIEQGSYTRSSYETKVPLKRGHFETHA